MKKLKLPMPSNKKRLVTYVSERKHKELKSFCGSLGISVSHFIDQAIEEKADRERKQVNFNYRLTLATITK